MNIDDSKLDEFLIEIYHNYGDDFIHYNHKTLKHRIATHNIKLQAKDFEEYCYMILNNRTNFEEMFKYFSINVTEFFREPQQLNNFRQKVIPYLKTFPFVKIWCAGCSSGESPYSLAIILEEEGLLEKTQIYATDFNNRIIAHAKDGLYEIKDFQQSYTNYELSGGKKQFKEYFIKKGKFYQIKKHFKKHILFANHNLVTDKPFNEFQVIISKNVIIYFDVILKEKVINLFDQSLVDNGFLILGEKEYLPYKYEKYFQRYIEHTNIFHKKNNSFNGEINVN